jgi:hypothetical protein
MMRPPDGQDEMRAEPKVFLVTTHRKAGRHGYGVCRSFSTRGHASDSLALRRCIPFSFVFLSLSLSLSLPRSYVLVKKLKTTSRPNSYSSRPKSERSGKMRCVLKNAPRVSWAMPSTRRSHNRMALAGSQLPTDST